MTKQVLRVTLSVHLVPYGTGSGSWAPGSRPICRHAYRYSLPRVSVSVKNINTHVSFSGIKEDVVFEVVAIRCQLLPFNVTRSRDL